MTLLLAFFVGVLAGLRSLTAPAVVAWAVHLGWLRLDQPLALVGSTASVAIFTIFAVAELLADKLPKTPSRTAPLGLSARVVTGGLTGACIAAAGGQEALLGVLLGAVGGVAGAFGGYQARTRVVKALGTRDIVVALAEDILAIFGSILLVLRI
jgi:uncharacterized membrane protein